LLRIFNPDKTADERKGIYAISLKHISIFFLCLGQPYFGKIFDKLGTRTGLQSIRLVFGQIATAMHAFAKGVGKS